METTGDSCVADDKNRISKTQRWVRLSLPNTNFARAFKIAFIYTAARISGQKKQVGTAHPEGTRVLNQRASKDGLVKILYMMASEYQEHLEKEYIAFLGVKEALKYTNAKSDSLAEGCLSPFHEKCISQAVTFP